MSDDFRARLIALLEQHAGGSFCAADPKDKGVDVAAVIALETEIAESGTPLRELMERVGSAVADAAKGVMDGQRVKPWHEEEPCKAVILAGRGNNGGDGWVVARLLAEQGHEVALITNQVAEKISAEPARSAAAEGVAGARVLVSPTEDELAGVLAQANVVVDAILGTGFNAEQVREPYATWIRLANEAHAAGAPVLAVDAPSGLSAQTGSAATPCIEADATITMLKVKRGLVVPEAKGYVGRLYLAPLV